MGWTTIYISGRKGFIEEVLKNLDHSEISFMPGTPEGRHLHLLWMDEKTPLRDLKKAIGSKTVLKFRLRFFSTREEYLQSKPQPSPKLTDREKALISEMKSLEDRTRAVA